MTIPEISRTALTRPILSWLRDPGPPAVCGARLRRTGSRAALPTDLHNASLHSAVEANVTEARDQSLR
jgi:hypothetical protein